MCALLVLTYMQIVEGFDRLERVLIDSVMVVEIVLNEQADAAKLWDKTDQEPDLMHQS